MQLGTASLFWSVSRTPRLLQPLRFRLDEPPTGGALDRYGRVLGFGRALPKAWSFPLILMLLGFLGAPTYCLPELLLFVLLDVGTATRSRTITLPATTPRKDSVAWDRRHGHY